MTKLAKLKIAIERTRQSLLKKVKRTGLYENFGQKEVRQLENKHIDFFAYDNEMRTMHRTLQNFDNWCANYTG